MKGLLFTYALVAVGTVGTFKDPRIGLTVYVILAVLRPQAMWGFAGDLGGISQLVGVALLVSWLLKGLGSWNFGRGRGIVVAFGLFTVWAIISATLADSPRAWRWVESLLKFFLPFLAGVTLLQSESWTRRLLWTIVLSQGYVAYEMNFAYLVQGYNRIHLYGYGGMDNNSIGIALVTTLGPTVAVAAVAKTWRARAVAGAAALFTLHAIMLTFSRGAMVGLLAVGAMAIIILPKRPKQMAVLALALAVAIRLTGPELKARYDSAFVEQEQLDGSAESRLDLWRDCFTVALANPVFGVGPDHWPAIAPSFGYTFNKSAHSVWMQTMAELGFPGVFFLLSFFGLTFLKLWPIARARSRDPAAGEREALAIGIMLSTVGFAVSGQFVTLTGLEVPYYLVMVGVGLLITAPSARAVPHAVGGGPTVSRERTAQTDRPAAVASGLFTPVRRKSEWFHPR